MKAEDVKEKVRYYIKDNFVKIIDEEVDETLRQLWRKNGYRKKLQAIILKELEEAFNKSL